MNCHLIILIFLYTKKKPIIKNDFLIYLFLMSENKKIQLGLCCLNLELRKNKPTIFTSRRVTLKTLESKGINNLKNKIIQNLNDVLTMMDWNEKNGIKVFRLSSYII